MAEHSPINLRRSSIECGCENWALRLDKSVTLHGQARTNYLLDAWQRHKTEATAKTQPREGIAE